MKRTAIKLRGSCFFFLQKSSENEKLNCFKFSEKLINIKKKQSKRGFMQVFAYFNGKLTENFVSLIKRLRRIFIYLKKGLK